MTKYNEQDAVENNKRDEKEKVTTSNEDGWTKPLKFKPILCFYKKKVTNVSKQARVKNIATIIFFICLKMIQK